MRHTLMKNHCSGFPFHYLPEWKWEGDECCVGVTSKVKVTGKALNMESVKTKAGTFDAIKLESNIEGSNSKNEVTEWFVEGRSEEHTSELQSLRHLVCRL